MKIKQLIQSKYILWFIAYLLFSTLLLGFDPAAFVLMLSFYLICSLFAIFSDSIRRSYLAARKPMIKEELEVSYLYEEVLQETKKRCNELENVELFIIKGQGLKVEAIGRKTIVISKLAMESFSEDELKGLFASELGRIASYDVLINTFVSHGNFIFSVAVYFANLLLSQETAQKEKNLQKQVVYKQMGCSFVFMKMFYYLFKGFFYVLIYIGCLVGSIPQIVGGKERIYQADKFASDIGYNEELRQALYILEKLNISSITNKLKPELAERIARLEVLERSVS